LVFGNGKNWQGSVKLSPLSLSPPPSEFCNDENNSVVRSAMGALRNSQKISLLALALLFLFTFFNLILDAPRNCRYSIMSIRTQIHKKKFGKNGFHTLQGTMSHRPLTNSSSLKITAA
jgi:hypothetical protein